MTYDCIQEDGAGRVIALTGPNAFLPLNPSDVCHRSELLAKAPDLMGKYGVRLDQLSDGLKASLSRAITSPVPDGA